jgi:hypothetical protein
MALLNYWVCPGIVAGLAVFFFIFSLILFASCQLLAVQGPTSFTDEGIDYGKFEDAD